MKNNFLKKTMTLAIALLAFTAVVGCQNNNSLKDVPALVKSTVVADFSKGLSDNFEKSNGWTNGTPFNTYWNKDNVNIVDDHLSLTITPNEDLVGGVPYYGGEYRTYQKFGYGDYVVSMKAQKGVGIASTFFTYTGPSSNDPHDEIDIEFLGKDTTKVQFNYFTNGKGGHEYMYNLGFDASLEYHEYGFRWEANKITWFVDGVAVYQAKKDIPSHPGNIFMNDWCGDAQAEKWMGKYTGSTGTADYKYVACSAEPVGDLPEKVEDTINWSTIEANDFALASNDNYTVTLSEDAKSATVSYTDLTGGTYVNVNMPAPTVAKTSNVFHTTIKNNGTDAAQVRVNLNVAGKTGNNITANKSALGNGEEVRTDLDWGGSYFDIPAGEEVEAVVFYEGEFNTIEFMIDSAVYQDTKTYTNSITFSDLKFGVQGEVEVPTPTETPEDVPTGDATIGAAPELGAWADKDTYALGFATQSGYTVTVAEDTKSAMVTYTNIAGGSYSNITMAAPSIAVESNLVAFRLQNYGHKSVNVRVNLIDNSKTGNNMCANVSATVNGEAVNTDLEWGGSYVTVASGADVLVVVKYAGKFDSLELMIDTATYQDTNSYSGKVNVLDLRFDVDEDYVAPGVEPTPEETGLSLTFSSGEAKYVITNGTGTNTVTYAGVEDNTYTCVCATLAAPTEAYGLKLHVKNNGTAAVALRFDLGHKTAEGALVSDITADTVCDYLNDDKGAQYTLAAGAEKDIILLVPEGTKIEGLNVFIDSIWAAETASHTGEVVLSGYEYVVPQPLSLTFSSGEAKYVITNGTGTNTVAYTGVEDNSYTCICADVTAPTGAKTLKITVKNNGTAAVALRFDLGHKTTTGALASDLLSTTVCDYFNDDKGAQYTVAAGAEVQITLQFDETATIEGLNIFIDSIWAAETASHTGEVVFSGYTFE